MTYWHGTWCAILVADCVLFRWFRAHRPSGRFSLWPGSGFVAMYRSARVDRTSRAVASRLTELRPGQGAVLTLTDQTQYIAMHRDDFEHIARLAGVQYVERTADSANNGDGNE